MNKKEVKDALRKIALLAHELRDGISSETDFYYGIVHLGSIAESWLHDPYVDENFED